MWSKGKATLQEIETHWSLADLFIANAVLDLEEDAEAEADNRIEEQRRSKRP